ncbi:MAG: IS66 family insertion sequence element accessory protein TnpB [Gammaproteobacteria bacterium]
MTDIYLCLEPVDFRKGIGTLAILVESVLSMPSMSGQLFVFRNRRRDKVKILYWERNGFCLWQKQLEQDRFHWPAPKTAHMLLTGEQLNWLLDGLNITLMQPHPVRRYDTVI